MGDDEPQPSEEEVRSDAAALDEEFLASLQEKLIPCSARCLADYLKCRLGDPNARPPKLPRPKAECDREYNQCRMHCLSTELNKQELDQTAE